MRLTDEELGTALKRLQILQQSRPKNGPAHRYIDGDTAYPGLSFDGLSNALQELQEHRRQCAWVRQQMDP